MLKSVNTLLKESQSREARANLITIEQILSTYEPHKIGAPTLRSTAPARMVEIFNDLIMNPLYLDLSRHVPAMGYAGESEAAVTAITHAAMRLVDQDNALSFGTYTALVPSSRHEVADSRARKHFNSNYFPPIVPINDALAKAEARWMQDSPEFIPVNSYQKGVNFRTPRSGDPI